MAQAARSLVRQLEARAHHVAHALLLRHAAAQHAARPRAVRALGQHPARPRLRGPRLCSIVVVVVVVAGTLEHTLITNNIIATCFIIDHNIIINNNINNNIANLEFSMVAATAARCACQVDTIEILHNELELDTMGIIIIIIVINSWTLEQPLHDHVALDRQLASVVAQPVELRRQRPRPRL